MELHKVTAATMARMAVPRIFWTVSIDEVSVSVKDKFSKYLSDFPVPLNDGIGLLITGPEGVGKTSMAVLALAAAAAHRRSGFYTTGVLFIEKTKPDFNRDQSYIDRCRDVDLLVLDDMTRDILDARGALALVDLVRLRVSNARATILVGRDPAHFDSSDAGIGPEILSPMADRHARYDVADINRREANRLLIAKKYE